MPPTLTTLPPELLLEIGTHLTTPPRTLAPLLLVSRRLHALLNTLLYTHALTHITTKLSFPRGPSSARILVPLPEWTIYKKWTATLRLLLSYGLSPDSTASATDIYICPTRGWRPFWATETMPLVMLAARFGREREVCVLLRAGADPRAHDSMQSLLHVLAAGEFGVETVRLALEMGAEVEGRDFMWRTPVMAATGRGREGVLAVFVGVGADVAAEDKVGVTALQAAVWMGNGEAVRVLVQAGALVRARNREGREALHEAAACVVPCVDVMRALVECGADVRARVGGSGATAWEVYSRREEGEDEWEGEDDAEIVALLKGR